MGARHHHLPSNQVFIKVSSLNQTRSILCDKSIRPESERNHGVGRHECPEHATVYVFGILRALIRCSF